MPPLLKFGPPLPNAASPACAAEASASAGAKARNRITNLEASITGLRPAEAAGYGRAGGNQPPQATPVIRNARFVMRPPAKICAGLRHAEAAVATAAQAGRAEVAGIDSKAPPARAFRCRKCGQVFRAAMDGKKIVCPHCPPATPPEVAPPAAKKSLAEWWKRLEAKLPERLRTGKKRWLLIPGGAGLLILLLISIAFRRGGNAERRQVTLLTLEEGENRMVVLRFDPAAAPSEIKTADAAVAETAIFLLQREPKPLLHVLVTAVAPGKTGWSVRFADGRRRIFQTVVRRSTPRVGGDRSDALRMIAEGDRLERISSHDPAGLYRAMGKYREAGAILRTIPYGTAEPSYKQAGEGFKRVEKRWKEAYAQGEGELALARMKGDRRSAREALRKLLQLAPEERSAQYQKNATLLNYFYRDEERS